MVNFADNENVIWILYLVYGKYVSTNVIILWDVFLVF